MAAPIRFINPAGLVRSPGYTQVVEAMPGSRTVCVSGQLGTTPDGKINSFLADMAHLPILREVRARHLNTAALPASTTVAVLGFALPGALLEVEVIAVVASTP